MKIKTCLLEGHALNYAVCVAELGYGTEYRFRRYSTDYSEGGVLIEREGISTVKMASGWMASVGSVHDSRSIWIAGSSQLVAAMRCYVATKLGEEIEIPENL